jgi:hypothetical protein
MSTVRSPKSHGTAAYCRFADNPFFVLGLGVDASLPEIRRAAARLLAALEAGDPAVAHYDTPVGPQPRTGVAVRHAVTRLRDRDERVQCEIWAATGPASIPPVLAESSTGWAGAHAAFGWSRR